MSERKRRLPIETRSALDLALWPRESRVGVLPSDLRRQGGALFDRRDIDAAVERGAKLTSAEREALLRGTFDNGPSERRAESITMETLRDMQRLLSERTIAMPQTIAMSPSLYEQMRRFGGGRSDDQTDTLAWATGIDWSAAEVRERARLRAAQYEREAPWRERILASIPAPLRITAAELRARVVLPTLRERLGLVTP